MVTKFSEYSACKNIQVYNKRALIALKKYFINCCTQL